MDQGNKLKFILRILTYTLTRGIQSKPFLTDSILKASPKGLRVSSNKLNFKYHPRDLADVYPDRLNLYSHPVDSTKSFPRDSTLNVSHEGLRVSSDRLRLKSREKNSIEVSPERLNLQSHSKDLTKVLLERLNCKHLA